MEAWKPGLRKQLEDQMGNVRVGLCFLEESQAQA